MTEIPLPDPPLRDEEVALRPWADADLEALVAALQDPEIPRWTTIPSPYDEREGLRFLTAIDAERRAGRELSLAIVAASSGQLLGGVGLTRLDWSDRKAEVGYWVAAGARRRSVGTRAVRLLSHWALGRLALERLELLANPENEPSQRLALSAGFTREGLLRQFRRRRGEREDLVMFSRLRSDLEP